VQTPSPAAAAAAAAGTGSSPGSTPAKGVKRRRRVVVVVPLRVVAELDGLKSSTNRGRWPGHHHHDVACHTGGQQLAHPGPCVET
jgi:hypothetical protein